MDVSFYVKEKVLMLCGAEFRSHLGMATNTPSSLRNTSHFSRSHLSPSTPLALVANVEPLSNGGGYAMIGVGFIYNLAIILGVSGVERVVATSAIDDSATGRVVASSPLGVADGL
ncbi:hypothetical protein BHM03_00001292 [Ensete ventricosum]|nr:hypothetical protein BHM03_00001292 [Ensete ventricosum]